MAPQWTDSTGLTTTRTLDHEHVHVYGADLGLGQTFALLQQTEQVVWRGGCVGLGSERHHLPHRHP